MFGSTTPSRTKPNTLILIVDRRFALVKVKFIRFFRGAPSLSLLDKNLPCQYQALMLIVTFPSDASALLVLVQVYS